VLGVLTGEGLLMKEMRATQAHTDLAMVAESDQVGVRIRRAAAPAVDRLGGVGLRGRAGDGGDRGICSFPASECLSPALSSRISRMERCGIHAKHMRRLVHHRLLLKPLLRGLRQLISGYPPVTLSSLS
jgi:hypothetical protein